MAETLCCFGLTTVRMGTRIIAYLQFCLQSFAILLLMIKYFSQWSIADELSTEDQSTASTPMSKTLFEEMSLDFDYSIFSQLSGAILVIYTSYYLKIATYTHNLMYLNFWMILNCINFLTTAAFITCASLRTGRFGIFLTGLIGCLISSYKIYVVYQFYTDEILTVAVTEGQNPSSSNNGDQSLSHSHTAVEIGTETIRTNDHHRLTLDVKNITQNTN